MTGLGPVSVALANILDTLLIVIWTRTGTHIENRTSKEMILVYCYY